jgi:hypothetical protein
MQGKVKYKKVMETKFEFKSILWQGGKEGRKEGKDPVLPPDSSSCWVGSSSAKHIYIMPAHGSFVISTLIIISFLGSAIAS